MVYNYSTTVTYAVAKHKQTTKDWFIDWLIQAVHIYTLVKFWK